MKLNRTVRLYNTKKILICCMKLMKGRNIAFYNMNDTFRGKYSLGKIKELTEEQTQPLTIEFESEERIQPLIIAFESVYRPEFDNENNIIFLPGITEDKDTETINIRNKRILRILFQNKKLYLRKRFKKYFTAAEYINFLKKIWL